VCAAPVGSSCQGLDGVALVGGFVVVFVVVLICKCPVLNAALQTHREAAGDLSGADKGVDSISIVRSMLQTELLLPQPCILCLPVCTCAFTDCCGVNEL
jgi:hypothetical protein